MSGSRWQVQDQWDGLVGQVTCYQPWWSEFNLWDSHRRKELTPISCLLIFTCVLYIHTDAHIPCKRKYLKKIQQKIVLSMSSFRLNSSGTLWIDEKWLWYYTSPFTKNTLFNLFHVHAWVYIWAPLVSEVRRGIRSNLLELELQIVVSHRGAENQTIFLVPALHS